MTNAVKARRKRLGRRFCREINSDEDSILAMIVFVPGGFVPIGIKPFTDIGHRSRKFSGA